MTPSEKGKAALIKHLEKSGTGKEKLAIAEAAVVKDESGERAGALCTIEYMKANGVNAVTIQKAEKYVRDRDGTTEGDEQQASVVAPTGQILGSVKVEPPPPWPGKDLKVAEREDKAAEKEEQRAKALARKNRLSEINNMEPDQVDKLVAELQIELPANAGKNKVANAIADAEEAKAEAARLHPPGPVTTTGGVPLA